MNSWIKRSLAFLLCLCMLCAVLPAVEGSAEDIELVPVEEAPGEEEIAILDEDDLAELAQPANPNGEAPYVSTNPSSITKTAGYTAKFTVKATGSSLKYQWYYRTSSSGSWQKTSLTGNTTATLSVKAKTTRNGYQYRCKVYNAYGYMYSKAATLTVKSGAKPSITAQPESVSATKGATAKFTVKASGATSYQWYYRTSSTGTWHKATLTGNKTATLSVYAKSTRSGYQYRCKVSNSNGYVYTSAAKLTVKSGAKPSITTQPKSITKAQDYTAKFTVKASNATKYQWYYRTSSSGTWKKSTLSSATKATLSVKATAARSGYQYRCRVSNANGYVYSNTVTLTVNLVTYRALLIGQTYNSVTKTSINPLFGDKSQALMYEALNNVQGARGGFIWTDDWTDVSHDTMQWAIDYAFGSADTNDVSIFYYNGHGVVTGSMDYAAGALVTVESDGGIGYVYTYELANWLSAIPGKVVVILDSCGAGAAIAQNGEVSFLSNEEAAAQFGELAIASFAEKDTMVDNAGELCTSKFYVLAAAPYNESSWAYNTGGFLTTYLKQGLIGSMPADTSGNGKVTLQELYKYIDSCVWQDQTTCVYPENSSYSIFAKK